jgi:glycerophosphoryl diester phosphodiesterase
MIVLSHRGLDLDAQPQLPESSRRAFENALQNGFGLEVDLQLVCGELVIWHDMDVKRLTGGQDQRKWDELTHGDLAKIESEHAKLVRFVEILQLLKSHKRRLVAVHIKSANQTDAFLTALEQVLALHKDLHQNLLVFDLKPEAASRLRQQFSELGLGASVSESYDIQRFQAVAGGTLLSAEELMMFSHAYNWAWLDEWDRRSVTGGDKVLYSAEPFQMLRQSGFRVAVISPELHKNEKHPDGQDLPGLMARWSELKKLNPDAICTDYPNRLAV